MKDFIIKNGVLKEYTGQGGDVFILAGVTDIADWAFKKCKNPYSITIPMGVTNIGEHAFDCTTLQGITVNEKNSVYRSENNCLIERKNNQLILGCQNSRIPDTITSIRHSAFYGCEKLKSITIPNGVTSIENGTFTGCKSLQSVTIPDSVTTIGSQAFQGCSNLQSITIPR